MWQAMSSIEAEQQLNRIRAFCFTGLSEKDRAKTEEDLKERISLFEKATSIIKVDSFADLSQFI